MIPTRIHFVWLDRPMPPWARQNIDQFRSLNQRYLVRVHGEEVLVPEYEAAYRRAEHVCTRADLLALSALKRYGGWYFDADFWPFRGLDSIREAWGLTGNVMFVTEQHGHMSFDLPIANGVMAATTDWKGWTLVDQAVQAAVAPVGWADFGPFLLTRLVRQKPRLFEVAAWPWFYPADIRRATRLYDTMVAQGETYARRLAPTAGQLPAMMHLWCAGGDPKPICEPGLLATLEPGSGPHRGARAVIAALPEQWQDASQPFRALANGLAVLGFAVDVKDVTGSNLLDTADLLVIWNGRADLYGIVASEAARFHVPTLFVEHGFWDRRAHVQIDHEGILHWASWAKQLRCPAPPDGATRLARFWPQPLHRFAEREGYALVLGQLAGDSQMDDSELKGSAPLERAISRYLKDSACIRPHPLSDRNRRHEYLPLCPGETLADAVVGAKYCVTINSNSGNEALAMGCPVLAIGPSLYGAAGVALEINMAGLRDALQRMGKGWRPAAAAVRNYLEWLACRQFGQDELRSGEALAPLVAEAMG
jgi:hypothetical protein